MLTLHSGGFAMAKVNRDRSAFLKILSDVTLYMGEEGDESEAGTLPTGAVIFDAVRGTESRTLGGKHVPVVLITVGADGKGW